MLKSLEGGEIEGGMARMIRARDVGARTKVLVVDDDEAIRWGLCRALERRGFAIDHVGRWSEVERRYESFRPDVIVMDHLLADGEGVALLAELRTFAPSVPVVILTGHGSIDLAVRAMRDGASHFLTKPPSMEELEKVLRESVAPKEEPRRRTGARRRTELGGRVADPFVGRSEAIVRLREQVERILDGDRPILVLGETGTGKSVLARWIHQHGDRAAARFVDLNCAALSRELLDSEIFGHERGAFTGAQATKVGLLEAAHTGTLFLDEIGDMDVAIQPKFLKALEEKKFRRLGDVRDRSVDVRLVSATHQDLAAGVRNKTFRSDLYYRISALRVTVPPLRHRREDLAPLARHVLDSLCEGLGRARVELTAAAENALVGYGWPGNVRELKNVLDRALYLVEGSVIDACDLHFDDLDTPTPSPFVAAPSQVTLKEAETQLIERVLREEGGRVQAAARRLGMARSSLYHKLKTLGLKTPRA